MNDKLRNFVLIVLIVFLALAITFCAFTPLAEDIGWCMENYSLLTLPRCMFYENSIFGKWVNPPLW